MQRRALLGTTAALIGTAGCLGDSTPQARVAWLSIVNDSPGPVEAILAVREGDETRFEETYDLGTESDAAAALVERPVDGTGEFVVGATVGDDTRTVETTGHVDGDEDCVGVTFLVSDTGTLHVDLVRAMQRCTPATPD